MTAARRGWSALLVDQWAVAAAYTGAILFLLAPLMRVAIGQEGWLLYLCGPVYMAHQVEEHWRDRFRRFVNDRVCNGRDALTPNAVWWINVPGVWAVNLAALYAARTMGAGAGFVAPYLMLVNAVGHAAAAIRFGCNPGLATALLLFVPLGGFIVATVPASPAQHMAGLAIAILIHLVIIGAVGARLRRLAR